MLFISARKSVSETILNKLWYGKIQRVEQLGNRFARLTCGYLKRFWITEGMEQSFNTNFHDKPDLLPSS